MDKSLHISEKIHYHHVLEKTGNTQPSCCNCLKFPTLPCMFLLIISSDFEYRTKMKSDSFLGSSSTKSKESPISLSRFFSDIIGAYLSNMTFYDSFKCIRCNWTLLHWWHSETLDHVCSSRCVLTHAGYYWRRHMFSYWWFRRPDRLVKWFCGNSASHFLSWNMWHCAVLKWTWHDASGLSVHVFFGFWIHTASATSTAGTHKNGGE